MDNPVQPDPPYHRIILKLSGDILKGEQNSGIDFQTVARIAGEIADIHSTGLEIGIVVGGGNLFRGSDMVVVGYDQITADNMGMLSTVINALAIQNGLENLGVHTRVMTAIRIVEVAEPFIQRRAIRHIEKGRVVLFAAGTGHPLFTTDTAAALRASQIKADVILKGTKVSGVYDKDPKVASDAVKFDRLDYMEAVRRELKVMDLTAVAFCRDHKIPIIVFNLLEPGNLMRVVCGENIGTIIEDFQ